MNLNKIILVGRVGRDPELKALPNGSHVATFSLATTRVWRDKDGEKSEETEWHNVVFWNKQAEIIAQYVKKGSLLLVEGRVHTRSYDKDGVRMYRTEIMGETFQLPPRSLNGGGEGETEAERKARESVEEFDAGKKELKKGKGLKSQPKRSNDIAYPEDEINPDDIPF